MKQLMLFIAISLWTFLFLMLFDGAKSMYIAHGILGVCIFLGIELITITVTYISIQVIIRLVRLAFKKNLSLN